MNEAPQNEAAAPSDNLFDLYGMKVHVSDLFPPNFIGFIPTNPPYHLGDVASHSIRMSEYAPFPVSLHDLLEIEPISDLHHAVMRLDAERRLARFERDFVGSVISSNITSNAKPIDAGILLADIEKMIREAEEAKRKQDRALVETFLDAGFMITVSEVAHKPMMILTEDFRATVEEIMDERAAGGVH